MMDRATIREAARFALPVVVLTLILALVVVLTRSCEDSPLVPLPDKPLPPATMPDAGVRETAIDDALRERLDALEGRVGEIEAEQARRRATFTRGQNDELARVQAGGRESVATWLDDFARQPSPSSSPSP